MTIRDSRFTIHGFTLVEMLFAAVMTSIMLLMIYQIFKKNTDFWHKSESDSEILQTARFAIDQIEREIRSAIAITPENAGTIFCYGNDGNLAPVVPKQTNSIRDEFFFIAAARYAKDESDLAEVGYWVSSMGTVGPNADRDDVLKRHYKTSDMDYTYNPAGGSMQFVEYVTGLDFNYWKGDGLDNDGDGLIDEGGAGDEGGWTPNGIWDSRLVGNQTPAAAYDNGRFPLKIKVTLQLQDINKAFKVRRFYTVIDNEI